MSVEVKSKKSEDRELLFKHVVDDVISLSVYLENINLWWFAKYELDYRYGEDDNENSSMIYRVSRGVIQNIIKESINLDLRHIQQVYSLEAERPYINELDHIDGSIKIALLPVNKKNKYKAYVLEKKEVTPLAVSVNFSDESFDIFEYPPRSLVSTIFYTLNPKVERCMRELAKQYLTPEGYAEVIGTWEYAYDRIMSERITIDLSQVFDEIRQDLGMKYDIAQSFEFNTENSPRYKLLTEVGIYITYDYYDNVKDWIYVRLKIDDDLINYYTDERRGLVYFLRKMVPRSDVVALSEDVSFMLKRLMKVPVLVKVLEGLDGEWFSMFAKLYQSRCSLNCTE
ncbi:MAG: hypothetical protein QXH21_08450 [Ignisphaera sp.]